MLPLVILAIEDESEKVFMTWLYLQYRRLIYSEVRKIVGDTDEAEDLLQSIVEKLIEKLPLLRGMEQSKLVNYIISTAKNTAYNSLRGKEQEILWEDQEELADPAPMPEDHILAQEDLSRLARVWIDLDKKNTVPAERKVHLKEKRQRDCQRPEYAAGQCADGAGPSQAQGPASDGTECVMFNGFCKISYDKTALSFLIWRKEGAFSRYILSRFCQS